MVTFESLTIQSPKRSLRDQRGWDGFFPYYAGYPESFARALLKSAALPKDAIVFDPWNGSGTTTFSASQLGLTSRGFDLNPVMIVISRARLLPPSEADSIEPLARDTIKGIRADLRILRPDDPLLWWFEPTTAALLRVLERRIRSQLVGGRTLTADGVRLEHISGLAATFYVALFSMCRQMVAPFRSSNPTWLRKPKADENRINVDGNIIISTFVANIKNMAMALNERAIDTSSDYAKAELQLANTTSITLVENSVDFILTSPPYCTRIDYSAATRIELAVMHPLVDMKIEDLGRQMIGSTRVPDHEIAVNAGWGPTCRKFITALKSHSSKASAGYYYKTHLDYFEKMARSLSNLAKGLKPAGAAIFVVQDSYYKDIHNDLPGITIEMAAAVGLQLRRRDNFEFKRSMAGINPHTRTYKRKIGAVEAVLCFEKFNR